MSLCLRYGKIYCVAAAWTYLSSMLPCSTVNTYLVWCRLLSAIRLGFSQAILYLGFYIFSCTLVTLESSRNQAQIQVYT